MAVFLSHLFIGFVTFGKGNKGMKSVINIAMLTLLFAF